MDNSYLSIIVFIIITVVYCLFGKKQITLDSYLPDGQLKPNATSLATLGIYFLVVISSQFAINSTYLINKCGGSAGNNIAIAALITFLPWIFIFGIVIATLIIFPGFKSPFANVVGYFAISRKANEILGNILVDTDIDKAITDEKISVEDKNKLQKSAQLILKLCANKSVLINQITPENFISAWNTMSSLMKDFGKSPEILKQKEELLKLVVLKDNIGEMMWYIYTCVLLASIISFQLATQGCNKTVEQLKEGQAEWINKQSKEKKKQELVNANPVKIT